MTEFFSAIATLLLVMDPLGNVPAFLACLKDMEVMIFASRRPDQLWQTGAATTVAWIATVAILMFSPALSRVLGRRGLVACERLMGMVLTVVAVQMFLDGLKIFVEGKR